MRFCPRKSTVLALTLALSAATAAQATETGVAGGDCSEIAALKLAYLACERGALSGQLATGDIAGCSAIYYDLKERAFGGEFGAIRDWYERAVALEVSGLDTAKLSGDARVCG